MADTGGLIYLNMSSRTLEVSGSVTRMPLTRTNEARTGPDGTTHRVKRRVTPTLSVELHLVPGLDLQAIANEPPFTIEYKRENGEVWVLTDAFLTGEPSEDITEGTVPVEFAGTSWTKAKAAA